MKTAHKFLAKIRTLRVKPVFSFSPAFAAPLGLAQRTRLDDGRAASILPPTRRPLLSLVSVGVLSVTLLPVAVRAAAGQFQKPFVPVITSVEVAPNNRARGTKPLAGRRAGTGLKSNLPKPNATAGNFSPAAILSALAQIESGGNPAAVGDRGRARGAWQMWAAAKKEARSQKPGVRSEAELAGGYWTLMQTRLTKQLHRAPTIPEIYAAWNLGYAGFARRGFDLGRCPRLTRERGQNLLNLLTAFPPPPKPKSGVQGPLPERHAANGLTAKGLATQDLTPHKPLMRRAHPSGNGSVPATF